MLFFNEWRVAARAASAAERAVTHAYMLYLGGHGEPPTAQLIDAAKRKRALADDLFSVALERWREGGRGPLRD
ncbi:hypothetical protein ACFPOE_04670 [Caenimonas terrae]|uniref:Uncharacterized protein n=1 Tax=Caenimonas terrae TaxID=696074 RepID=A0ABW0NA76_9BURK